MRYTACVLALMLSGSVIGARDKQDRKGTNSTSVKADNGTAVTLAGCVEIGGGTSFLLTNITSERPEKGKRTDSRASYALVGREGLDLGPYIHQRVELTGVFVKAATKGDDDDKIEIKEKSAPSQTVKVERGPANQFLVATVKSVAPSCQP